MIHGETARQEVIRHLSKGKPVLLRPSGGWQDADWKEAHEAAARYLKLPKAKITRKG